MGSNHVVQNPNRSNTATTLMDTPTKHTSANAVNSRLCTSSTRRSFMGFRPAYLRSSGTNTHAAMYTATPVTGAHTDRSGMRSHSTNSVPATACTASAGGSSNGKFGTVCTVQQRQQQHMPHNTQQRRRQTVRRSKAPTRGRQRMSIPPQGSAGATTPVCTATHPAAVDALTPRPAREILLPKPRQPVHGNNGRKVRRIYP